MKTFLIDKPEAFSFGETTLPEVKTGEVLPEESFNERVRILCRHFDLMVEVFDEELGCRMFRKVKK